MNDWFPAFTTTGLLAVALWLGRGLIANRLSRTVEHEFAAKLESVKLEHRITEEKLKSQIRSRESEVESLRSDILRSQADRQRAIDQRTVEAVDQLWTSVRSLDLGFAAARALSMLFPLGTAMGNPLDQRALDAAKTLHVTFEGRKFDSDSASNAEPYLPPTVWASYKALHAFCLSVFAQWVSCVQGHTVSMLVNNSDLHQLIHEVLPARLPNLLSGDPHQLLVIAEELRTKLKHDVRALLSGDDHSDVVAQRSVRTLQAAARVTSQIQIATSAA